MSKDPTYRKLINSQRWQQLRRATLKAHPLCEDCKAKGFVTSAHEVHHITPVEYGRADADKARLMFNPANLRALCHHCHVEAHKVLGRSGMAAMRRINQAHVKSFIDSVLDNKFAP